MIEGHGIHAPASDGVRASWTNGVFDDNTQHVFVSEGQLKCKIQVEGASNYLFNGKIEDDLKGPTLVFLNHPDGGLKREFTRKGTRERSLTLVIPFTDECLGGCSRDDPAVDRVVRELGEDFKLKHYKMPKAAYSCLSGFFDYEISDRNQEKFQRAKIDELSCILLDLYLDDHRSSRGLGLTAREIRKTREAHDILQADLSTTPVLSELGKAVGLNRTRLNQGFKETFGASVFQVLHQERMRLACELLEQGHVTTSAVAEACGYEHLSNFSTAFKSFYGISPSNLRRRRFT
jgi:AraC-like DNA-binding protein